MNPESSSADKKTENGTNASFERCSSISQDNAKTRGSFADKGSNQQGKESVPRSPKSLPTVSARPRNLVDRPLIPQKPHALQSGTCGTGGKHRKQPSHPLDSQLQSQRRVHTKTEMTGNTRLKPSKPQPPPKPQHLCTSGSNTVTTIPLKKERNEKTTISSYVKRQKQFFEEKQRSFDELSKRRPQLLSEAKQFSPGPQRRPHAHTAITTTLEREQSEKPSYIGQQNQLYEGRQRVVAQSPGASKRMFNPAEAKQSPPLQHRVLCRPPVPLPRSPYSGSLVNKKSGTSAEPLTLSLSVSSEQNHSSSEGNKLPVKQASPMELCRERGITNSEPQDCQLASSDSTAAVPESSVLVCKRSRHGSERRRFTFNSSSQSLLDRARQLSGNRKWCDQPEVKESEDVLAKLNKHEILLLQEAIFEVITSEATYHLNLATLTDVFMDDPKMDPNRPEGEKVMNKKQHSAIFSNVKEIREVSASFLEELQSLMSEDIFLLNIFPILEDYAENRFVCYERYCASQKHRLEELENCGKMSENFQRHLEALEMEAKQTLQSLLSAPMQRITKLPLLMKEIQKRAPNDHPSHEHMKSCHKAVEKVAGLCNKGAGKIGDLVHLDSIWQKLNFDQLKLRRSKPFHFNVPGRQLKKEGSIDRLVLKDNSRHNRVKPYKTQLYVFVFTDLLMITTNDKNRHSVVDYCPLAKLTVEDINTVAVDNLECSISNEDSALSDTEWAVAVAREKHGFLVTLLESVSKQMKSYIFIVNSDNEKTQWMESLSQPSTTEVVIATPKLLDLRRKKTPLKKSWREQPQVVHSGIVQTLTNQRTELQEALFAVFASEEVYLRDLDTLVDHYMCDSGLDPSLPKEQRILKSQEHHHIFSNIKEIAYTSRGLLKELQHRQTESILVDSISDILLLCVERMFHCYIHYGTNLPNQLKELENSIETNESFSGYLKQLEEDHPPLRSLLETPMNRVKKLPHLVWVVLEKMQTVLGETEPLKLSVMQSAFRAVEKVERLSVTGQQKIRKLNELHDIEKQLDFGIHKPFTLMSVNHSLVRQGTLVKLEVTRLPFIGTVQKKLSYRYVIVLTDHILVTKKKENCYKLVDHSPLNKLQVEPIEACADLNTSFPGGEDRQASASWAVSKAGEEHAFLVTFLELKKSYIFVAENDEQRREWMESLMDQKFQVEEEDTTLKLEYVHVRAVGDYEPQALDELTLKTGDIVRVYRVTNEWCEGLKLQDLHWGRVPIDRVVQITQRMGEGSVQECLVEAIHDFQANEEDELSLEKGDVVKVSRKMAGWYNGKKLHSRENLWGWFPGKCTEELARAD